MGTWGFGIFENDTASDVRDGFRELIGSGSSVEDATEVLRGQLGTDSVFSVALALVQWETGRLIESVREEALRSIDAGVDLELWEPEQRPRRLAVLEACRTELQSPRRSPTRIRRQVLNSSPFEIGDLVTYEAESGDSVAFCVLENSETRQFSGTSVTALLLLLAFGRPDLPLPSLDSLDSLAQGLPARRHIARRFDRLMLIDGANAVGPRWTVIGNVPYSGEGFVALGQEWGQTLLHAKRPRQRALIDSWIEKWVERWTSGSYLNLTDAADMQQLIAGFITRLGERAAVEAWTAEIRGDLVGFLGDVASRLDRHVPIIEHDIDEWIALTLRLGADPSGRDARLRESIENLSRPDTVRTWLRLLNRFPEARRINADLREAFLEEWLPRLRHGDQPTRALAEQWNELRHPGRPLADDVGSQSTDIPSQPPWTLLKDFDEQFLDYLRWTAAIGTR